MEDEQFFVSLFTLHSEHSEKKGAGIDYISIETNFNNNLCLYIHRVDGTSIDCSWAHCIQPASQKTVISVAFRRAVKEIIIAYKSAFLNQVDVCPVLGTKLTYNNSHVSYLAPSFDDLLIEFLQHRHIDIESVTLTNPKPVDTDQRGKIIDQGLLNDWCSFHQKKAILQLLSAEANLGRLKS